MNIEKKRDELLITLRNIEEEANVLLDRIAAARSDLERVKTEEDAREFDRTHDLEAGFEYIELI